MSKQCAYHLHNSYITASIYLILKYQCDPVYVQDYFLATGDSKLFPVLMRS